MIPEATIRRLSVYLRCLRRGLRRGEKMVRSGQLARRCGTSASLVRKDLSYFGGFGIKGKGYRVESLIESIEKILGINKPVGLVLIGVGNLGSAILRYLQSVPYFTILGAFDQDQKKWGKKAGRIEILPASSLGDFLREHPAELGVIAIPPDGVQDVVNTLSEGGVKGVLSFALSELEVPEGMVLQFVDKAAELEFLYYKANKSKK